VALGLLILVIGVPLATDAGELSDLGPLAAPDLGPCRVEGERVADRIERRTRPLLGRPYAASPLGEGAGRDADPRIRFDAFDCTTWVETALALAQCDDRTLLERLDVIRYEGGEVDFARRRHLVSAQWVPGLEELGLVRRSTRAAFGDVTETIEVVLGAQRWAERRIARSLDLPIERVPFGRHRVEFVPVTHVRASSAGIDPGAIVKGAAVVRHASLRARRVVDEPLDDFIARFAEPRKWPIAGFQVLAVPEL
jgi:hypothetical protein